MVKRQLVSYSYTCDVCGGAISDGNSATRRVSWEGTAYVVDVCDEHSSRLGELLTQLKSFVDAGNRVTGRRGRRPAVAGASSAPKAPRSRGTSAASGPKRGDLGAVRAWARETGRPVSERGRIPGQLLAAYDAAHGGEASAAPASAPTAAEPAAAAADAAASSSASSSTATAAASRSPRRRRASASTAKATTKRASKAASKSPAPRAAKATPATSASKRTDLGTVRAWARENGRPVSERGRIPSELLAAYDAANGGAPAPAAPARTRRPRKAAPAAV